MALYIGYHLSLTRPCSPCESSSRRLSRMEKKKKNQREETRMRNFNSFHSRSDVTTGCLAAVVDSFRGFTLKKKEEERNGLFPQRLLSYYLFVGRQAFRVFNHLVSSYFCFSTASCYTSFSLHSQLILSLRFHYILLN